MGDLQILRLQALIVSPQLLGGIGDEGGVILSPTSKPLAIIPGSLIRAMAGNLIYREAAAALLTESVKIDAHLANAVETRATDVGTDYFLDHGRIHQEALYETFLAVRRLKDRAEEHFPLLGHAMNLTDYIAHFAGNLLPKIDAEPHQLASIYPTGDVLFCHDQERVSFEWSLSLYFGLSPLPLFGAEIPYDKRIGRVLSPLGFGIFPYLSLALNPDLAAGDHAPYEIEYQGIPRPVAEAKIGHEDDGSLKILVPQI